MFYSGLENNHIELILAHAKYLKAISYAKVKTDKVDSHTLAQLLRLNLIPAAPGKPGRLTVLKIPEPRH